MTDDIDEELKVALHQRAGSMPRRPDLARAAIRQAGVIRRRRRIGGAVAAAALAAVAVPVGLEAGDSLSRDSQIAPVDQDRERRDAGDDRSETVTPSVLTVNLSDLDPGDSPAVPYLAGDQVITDEGSVDIGVDADRVAQLAYAGGEVFFTVRDEEGALTLRSTDGSEQAVDAGPWSSPDGRYVAYLVDGTLEVEDFDGGAGGTLDVGAATISSLTFSGDEVFVIDGNDSALLRWRIGDPAAVTVRGVARPTAVSSEAGLVADMYRIDDLEASSCTQVEPLGDGEALWETCDHRVVGFSPDGRYAWGSGSYADGAGDGYVVVLDALTGEQVMRVDGTDSPRSPLSIVDGIFETDTALLLAAEQGGESTLVRCDLTTGGCERATEPAEVALPYEGNLPYELLA